MSTVDQGMTHRSHYSKKKETGRQGQQALHLILPGSLSPSLPISLSPFIIHPSSDLELLTTDYGLIRILFFPNLHTRADRVMEILIPADRIQARVNELAQEISH